MTGVVSCRKKRLHLAGGQQIAIPLALATEDQRSLIDSI